jgi:hypothetical protein
MSHRFASGLIAAAISVLFGGAAVAALAPRLPPALAANANDLQRAAWACEAGAPVLAPSSATAKSVPARYFLAGAGEAGTAEPPLVLGSHDLSGFGWLSDDRGWSVIRFRCALAPDLRRATAFGYSVLARAKAPASDPTGSEARKDATSRSRTWSADLQEASLLHGVPQTDDIDFSARCKPHSGRVTVSATRTVAWLKTGGYVVLALGDGAHNGLYVARGRYQEEVGARMPEFSVPADAPLFDWMENGRILLVNVGGDLAYSVPLKGAPVPVRDFRTVCSHEQ